MRPVRSQFSAAAGGIRFFPDGNGRCSMNASSVDSPSSARQPSQEVAGSPDRPDGAVEQFLHQHALCSENSGKSRRSPKARDHHRDRSATVPCRQQRAELPQQHLAIKKGTPCHLRLLHFVFHASLGPSRRQAAPVTSQQYQSVVDNGDVNDIDSGLDLA